MSTKGTLDQVVYLIEKDAVIESTIRDLDGYIDVTTTPHGVAPRYHLRDDVELWTWGVGGNFPRLIHRYETAAEAEGALEATFVHDFWNCSEISAYTTRADAERDLAERIADAEEVKAVRA